MMAMQELEFPIFERHWRCEVFTSGFHNGCVCSPDEPHNGWACEYRWMARSLPDTPAAEVFVSQVHWLQDELRKVTT